MKFGIPYMGSKSGIVKVICRNLPQAENFYDLFGGGFCVTHAMLALHPKRYKRFFFNEIEHGTVDLIQRAIRGEFNYDRFKPKFISREEFFKNKDTCAYTRLIWSFGNNQKDYLFGEDIEPYKRSLHNAVVFNEFDEMAKKVFGKDRFDEKSTITQRRLFSRWATKIRVGELQQLQRLQRLEQLEQLERLQQLERLERLERLELTSLDYRAVEIRPNSVVYCDPPYAGTAEYTRPFDHVAFWLWARECKHPIFISEYWAPDDFRIVLSIEKKSRLSGKGATKTLNECLFVNPTGAEHLSSIGVKTFPNTGKRRANW
jgi:site-specific DNA-adenine methylase